jgi:hypothetical protein
MTIDSRSENFYHLSLSGSNHTAVLNKKTLELSRSKKSTPSQAWCIRMIQKKACQPVEAYRLASPSEDKKLQIQVKVTERKNNFEHRGSRTLLKKSYDPTYLKQSFSVHENFYGARLNTSQL